VQIIYDTDSKKTPVISYSIFRVRWIIKLRVKYIFCTPLQGYSNYNQFIVQLETKYEVGLRDELKKLDRSSYIYKIDDFLLLHLFLEKNKNLEFLLDLEKKGLIHSLSVSIPLRYHNKFY
jgi:hypothetical protein